MKKSGKKAGEKKRTSVLLPRELVERIDALAGERGRTRFIEEALRRELRRRAWEEWLAFGEKLRGLTLEDILYAARSEVEKSGRKRSSRWGKAWDTHPLTIWRI
jgi:metal-responsive CopG/Arc/MetJ family transcriptional regulator